VDTDGTGLLLAPTARSSMSTNRTAALPADTASGKTHEAEAAALVSADMVWGALAKASFAVVSHVTADGEPRSSGVLYGIVGRRLYVATAADGWKARQIQAGQEVAVTVPVRRGGLLALLFPIPPATITFRARATVHAPGSLDLAFLSEKLLKHVPESRRTGSSVIELVPEGRFLTYGIGVPLMAMADPGKALARVGVDG
jgi:hypothetical protein